MWKNAVQSDIPHMTLHMQCMLDK